MRDYPRRNGQPKRLRFSVELSKQYSSLSRYRARFRIDAYPLHRREVNEEAAVADGQAGEAVPPAPYSHQKPCLSREPHGRDDVGHACAARDEGREATDRPVPDPAGILVARVSGME